MAAPGSPLPSAKLLRFLAKSPREKIAAIRINLNRTFKVGRQPTADAVLARHPWAAPAAFHSDLPFYIALRPDSDRNHKRYPELGALSTAWVHQNEASNATDLPRLYSLVLNIRQALEEQITGDFAELGVYRGNSAAVLAHYARAAGRHLYLFDTFEGFDRRDLVAADGCRQPEFTDISLAAVCDFVGEQNVRFIQGYFPASIPADLDQAHFSVVHLDCDLYQPIKAGMAFFFPRLSPGGLMIVHDYSGVHWSGVKQAVDEFLHPRPERAVLLPDRGGTAIIRKCAA